MCAGSEVDVIGLEHRAGKLAVREGVLDRQTAASQYADLARRMKGKAMGAGTVLDQTLIYGISDLGEPSGHIMTNYHVVLVGHGGGKVPGNRHVRLPGRKVTELVLTLMQTMGVPVTTWGSWDKTSKTMPEILV